MDYWKLPPTVIPMRKSKFTESQIVSILKEAEAGAVADVARKPGISAATFYAWRSKYGGMAVSGHVYFTVYLALDGSDC